MIDWYRDYDEINEELREMAKRQEAELDKGTDTRLFIGSGDDVCAFRIHNDFVQKGTRYEELHTS